MIFNNFQLHEIITLNKLCAQIILENGGETYRAEETVTRICHSLDLESEIIAIPTGVFITLGKDRIHMNTVIKRIKKRTVNLSAIHQVNNISRNIVKGELSVQDALEQLHKLHDEKSNHKLLFFFSAAVSSGFFALLLGGELTDFIVAAICGIVVHLMSHWIKIEDMFNFAISIIGGASIAIIAILCVTLLNNGNLDKIIIGAMTPLLPGLAMTTAVRDAMRGDLLSGVASASEALLVAIALAFGVGVILKIYYGL
ncbi:MAG: threonine/serine exporter family protein [Eubacteriales bacterium]